MSTIRRSAAAALALAASGVSMAATPAMAATVAPSATMVSAVNPSNIDPTTQTSLSIHKYLGAPTGQANDGTTQTVNLPTLSGVAFDIYQVTNPDGTAIDLTTNAGWAAATDLQGKAITSTEITQGYIVGTSGKQYPIKLVTTVTTDSTGTATFKPTTNFDSLYLGAENLSKSTNITDSTGKTYSASSITPTSPFLVTLPMTNPAGNAWMYDVNVYPKNQSNGITKTVVDQQTVTSSMGSAVTTNADSVVTYGLSGTITAGMTGTQMGAYALVDKLPTGTLFKDVTNVKAGTTALTAGTDYNVYVDGVLNGTPKDGSIITIAMTQSGLDKVAAAKAADAGALVTANVNVTTSLPAGDLVNQAALVPSNSYWQSVTNNPTATFNPDGSQPGGGDVPAIGTTPGQDTTTTGTTTPVTTTITSNTVETRIGQALLTKTDAQSGATLQGATFDLYSGIVKGDLTAPKAADCSNLVTDPTKKVMSGITTAADGTVKITGLQESDFYNNVAQPATGGDYIVYCLVETQAPSGYNLNAEPTAFYVTDYNTVANVSVQDEKRNLANNLPLTGGAGAGLLSLGGLVVVGGTLAARAASKKRREDEADELA